VPLIHSSMRNECWSTSRPSPATADCPGDACGRHLNLRQPQKTLDSCLLRRGPGDQALPSEARWAKRIQKLLLRTCHAVAPCKAHSTHKPIAIFPAASGLLPAKASARSLQSGLSCRAEPLNCTVSQYELMPQQQQTTRPNRGRVVTKNQNFIARMQ